MLKKLIEKINGFLEQMAQENERAFGKGKLDCCNLNKDQKAR